MKKKKKKKKKNIVLLTLNNENQQFYFSVFNFRSESYVNQAKYSGARGGGPRNINSTYMFIFPQVEFDIHLNITSGAKSLMCDFSFSRAAADTKQGK